MGSAPTQSPGVLLCLNVYPKKKQVSAISLSVAQALVSILDGFLAEAQFPWAPEVWALVLGCAEPEGLSNWSGGRGLGGPEGLVHVKAAACSQHHWWTGLGGHRGVRGTSWTSWQRRKVHLDSAPTQGGP